MRLFKKNTIECKLDIFQNIPVDITYFNKPVLDEITNNGLKCSYIDILRSASIHYQGKHRSFPIRIAHAHLDLDGSLNNSLDNFVFNQNERHEMQKLSTEIFALGLAIEASVKLFSVTRNSISIIDETRKRCDFVIQKNGIRIVAEAKGRKNHPKSSYKDIFMKKAEYGNNIPKYGFVTHIPRNGSPVSLNIIDPPDFRINLTKHEIIKNILYYYSRCSYLSGFHRLGDLLLKRMIRINSDEDMMNYNMRPLDFGNILKLGHSYQVTLSNYANVLNFFQPVNPKFGMNLKYRNGVIQFSLTNELLSILENQDYFRLLEKKVHDETHQENFSIYDDGTSMIFIPSGNPDI
ncbi:MAG: hypothetical protein JJU05_13970 [Verrucomicrobia bacterium]|nr:hypothetical protein [Verrucomicrobiota bacterium]MCH8528006.1 hypothetical protein [Kiritimatiellia bacterium]